MVDGGCKAVFHSQYLERNKYTKSDLNCANWVNLQHQLREALSELTSSQLIIKLLQKDLSKYLVPRIEPNHMYESPYYIQRGYEFLNDTEGIPGPNNGWIQQTLNHFVKPRSYTKYTTCGNMPTGKHIQTSNRFEPLSNIDDFPNSNRYNVKPKPTDSVREGKANQNTSRQRHSNGSLRRSTLQHKVQNARETPSHTKEMLTFQFRERDYKRTNRKLRWLVIA